jgi:hypothetical protein
MRNLKISCLRILQRENFSLLNYQFRLHRFDFAGLVADAPYGHNLKATWDLISRELF